MLDVHNDNYFFMLSSFKTEFIMVLFILFYHFWIAKLSRDRQLSGSIRFLQALHFRFFLLSEWMPLEASEAGLYWYYAHYWQRWEKKDLYFSPMAFIDSPEFQFHADTLYTTGTDEMYKQKHTVYDIWNIYKFFHL